jgi:hypothetical protein
MDLSPMTMTIGTMIGFVYGAIVTFLAFLIAGAGHGWNSALVSAVSLLLIPLALCAWIRRGRALLLLAVVAAVVSDCALLAATSREGFDYLKASSR